MATCRTVSASLKKKDGTVEVQTGIFARTTRKEVEDGFCFRQKAKLVFNQCIKDNLGVATIQPEAVSIEINGETWIVSARDSESNSCKRLTVFDLKKTVLACPGTYEIFNCVEQSQDCELEFGYKSLAPPIEISGQFRKIGGGEQVELSSRYTVHQHRFYSDQLSEFCKIDSRIVLIDGGKFYRVQGYTLEGACPFATLVELAKPMQDLN